MNDSGRFFLISALILLGAAHAQAESTAADCAKATSLAQKAEQQLIFNPQAAEKKYLEAVELCGKSASLYYNLGLSLYNQKKYNDAKDRLETALTLNPDYAKAANDLAYIYAAHLHDRIRAEALARKAVKLEPGSKTYQDTLALVLKEGHQDIDIENPPQLGASRPNAVAVVIGNRNYKNTLIPTVEYAENDALLVKRYLVETLGFRESNIIYLKDADESDLRKVFGDKDDYRGILWARTRPDVSDIFIFYSGHGAPDPNTREGYLISSNADPFAIRFTSYPLNTLYENLSKLSADKHPQDIVLVLDACFSGASQRGMLIKDASPISIEITTPLLKMKNAVVFTSSQGNQISSWYPEKGHGLFTYHFLKALKESAEARKTVTAAQVEKALLGNDGVNDDAWRLYNREQVPQIVGDKNIVLVE